MRPPRKRGGLLTKLKDIKIDPKKEFLMVSQSFDRPVEIEESGELVLYLEDVSSNIHKFSTKVNVGEYID